MTTHDRERLVNAVHFFASGVLDCSVKKLFVLLYILDVRHFRQSGRAVTGLEYAAGDFGPYPHALSHEMGEYLRPDLAAVVTIEKGRRAPQGDVVRARADTVFSEDQFSRRHLRVMQETLDQLRDVPFETIDVDQHDNGAWRKALRVRKHQIIDLRATVDVSAPEAHAILEQAADYAARDAAVRLLVA